MATVNSSVLACNYAISASGSPDLSSKLIAVPSVASPGVSGYKLPVIKAQQARVPEAKNDGRRTALLFLGASLFAAAGAVSNSTANAGVIEEYLERSKANKVATLC